MLGPYRFGHIIIDGKEYHADVIVYPDRIDDTWRRREGHWLCLADLQEVLDEQPDTLVVGTGYLGFMRVNPEVSEALQKKGIQLIAQRTEEACAEFNRLRDTQKVVAALHLTC